MGEGDETDVHPRPPQQVDLGGVRRLLVDTDDRPRRKPEPGRRQGTERDSPAEAPSPGIVAGDVTRGRPDDDDRRRPARRLATCPVATVVDVPAIGHRTATVRLSRRPMRY